MRHPAIRPRSLLAAILLLVGAAAAAPAPATAQSDVDAMSPDELLDRAHEQQRRFEQLRQSRIPVAREREEGGCDQRIGRICIWFGGDEEEDFPEEPPETERGRRGLIGVLLETRERVPDPWVLGQLVHYLVEQRDFTLAERVADECGIDEGWWCDALLGYSFHVRGEFVAAEEAFRDALAAMPEKERARWTSLKYIVSEDAEEALDDLEGEARDARWELFWRLSDPLVLVPGNDRLTDHFARLVQARNRADAENPQGLLWDEDLEETLIRYGRIVGWSRTHAPGARPRGPTFQLQDTRRVVGHHHPRSRGYLFPEDFLESPSDVPPESWITAPREAQTWYAPPYAPDFRGLETQVGRFRRADRMLVVGAYRPAPAGLEPEADAVDPFTGPPEEAEAALFLVPLDGGPAVRVESQAAQGVFTLEAEPGRYVSSLEVLDAPERRAWRARQGVRQDPILPGLVAVSDLLILKRGAATPASLDEAVPLVRPGIRVAKDERFTVVWEVYGLQVAEPVQVTVGFTRGRPGFLARVGEFLGVLEPERPVEISFEDAATDEVQTAFRTMVLELPEDLDPGEYTLHLRLELPGSDAIVSSRPVVVEP